MFRFPYMYITFALVILVAPLFAAAQLENFNDPLRLSLSPQTPGPNEQVRAEVSGFGLDVGSATVSWYVDGSLERRGVGIRTFSFETGAAGAPLRLQVVAQEPGGGQASASRTIIPASVDLVWEGNTYTPPFYKGRALHSTDSSVTVTAYPNLVAQNGSRVSSSNLIYTWEQNGTVLQSQSGYGKRRATIENLNKREPLEVRVTVSTQSGSLKASEAIIIPVVTPVVRLYEHHPLLGIRFERDLSGGTLAPDESETTVGAYPYFFSIAVPADSALSYRWQVGSERVAAGESPHTLTLRKTGEGESERDVSVGLRHARELLQSAQNQFRILFSDDVRSQF